LLQKLAESCISPAFEASESCKILQNIAIPDRETGLIKALQADARRKDEKIRAAWLIMTVQPCTRQKRMALFVRMTKSLYHGVLILGR
jgi:hypothetical protein